MSWLIPAVVGLVVGFAAGWLALLRLLKSEAGVTPTELKTRIRIENDDRFR